MRNSKTQGCSATSHQKPKALFQPDKKTRKPCLMPRLVQLVQPSDVNARCRMKPKWPKKRLRGSQQ